MNLVEEQLMVYRPRTDLTIISRGRIVRVPIRELVRISKEGDRTVLYSQSDRIPTQTSMRSILNDLPVNDFFRVHRSHIISRHQITRIGSDHIELGTFEVPFTDYYRFSLIKRLGELLDRGYRDLWTPAFKNNPTRP